MTRSEQNDKGDSCRQGPDGECARGPSSGCVPSGSPAKGASRGKRSALRSVLVSARRGHDLAVVEAGGLGEAPVQGFPDEIVPSGHPRVPASKALMRLAKRLRDSLEGGLPAIAGPVSVRVTCARIVEADASGARAARRRILAAEAHVGGREGLPVWTRTVPLETREDEWPAGWIDAAARVLAFQVLPAGGTLAYAAERVAIDAFAAADILRLSVGRWLREGKTGDRVAGPAISIVDPGPWPASSRRVSDASGDAARGGALVTDGILREAPAGRGHHVRASWREPIRDGVHAIRVLAPEQPAPEVLAWLTTVIPVGPDQLIGYGIRTRAGTPIDRWGPEPLPAPAWWCENVGAALGPSLPDLTGVPVTSPALLLAPVSPRRPH